MLKSIAHASPDDAPAILELQKLAYQSEARLYDDWNIPPLTQTLDELINDFTTKICLKAEVEGKIVGSVRGHQVEDTCYIERLIVHPNFQGQGIGTTLMAQIESCFDSLSERLLLRQRLCLRQAIANANANGCGDLNYLRGTKAIATFVFTNGWDTKYSSMKKLPKPCRSLSWRNTSKIEKLQVCEVSNADR
jgi:GNAT superfamily N-acetyltransferase